MVRDKIRVRVMHRDRDRIRVRVRVRVTVTVTVMVRVRYRVLVKLSVPFGLQVLSVTNLSSDGSNWLPSLPIHRCASKTISEASVSCRKNRSIASKTISEVSQVRLFPKCRK
jgi:hypothetical protein